jgi:hypothetical protein
MGYLETDGPNYDIALTVGGNPAWITATYNWRAGGDVIPPPGKCDSKPWYGPLLQTPAPMVSGLTLTPPAVDTSLWGGLFIEFSCDISTWPAVSVECDLTTETLYVASIAMNSSYGGVDLLAQNGVPFPGADTLVASASFPGPVTSLPGVILSPTYTLLFISGMVHVLWSAMGVEEDTFVSAPEIPPDPPLPIGEPIEIGPC